MHTTTYSSLLIVSDGGQGFEDTSLTGLLRQTKDFLDSYHRPGGFRDYSRIDHWQNCRTVRAIMADAPSHADETTRHYYAPATIH
jgi:hypothetical protein